MTHSAPSASEHTRTAASHEVPEPMRRDVGLLGGLLGQVLEEYGREKPDSAGLLDDVEALRELTIAALEDSSEETLRKAEDLVSDGLLRTIEILGLFLALTGFVVGTSTAAVKASDWWQLVVAMVLLVAGSGAFLLMMGWLVSTKRGR